MWNRRESERIGREMTIEEATKKYIRKIVEHGTTDVVLDRWEELAVAFRVGAVFGFSESAQIAAEGRLPHLIAAAIRDTAGIK